MFTQIICPACGCPKMVWIETMTTTIIEKYTKPNKKIVHISKCKNCGKVFNTYE